MCSDSGDSAQMDAKGKGCAGDAGSWNRGLVNPQMKGIKWDEPWRFLESLAGMRPDMRQMYLRPGTNQLSSKKNIFESQDVNIPSGSRREAMGPCPPGRHSSATTNPYQRMGAHTIGDSRRRMSGTAAGVIGPRRFGAARGIGGRGLNRSLDSLNAIIHPLSSSSSSS